jgi:hypothetical protein
MTAETVKEKWRFYGSLGDPTSASNEKEEVEKSEGIPFLRDAKKALPFRGKHPAVSLEAIRQTSDENREFVRRFEEAVKSHGPNAASILLSQLNFAVRVKSRLPEFLLRFGANAEIRNGLFEMLQSGC